MSASVNSSSTQEPECQSRSHSEMRESDVRNCAYFLTKKQRLCRFPAAKNGRFCGAHAHLDQDVIDGRKRIPCPFDPKHTVFVDKLEKHKKRCNSRPTINKVYENEHVNAGVMDSPTEEVDKESHEKAEVKGLSDYSDEEVVAVVRKVIRAFNHLPKEALHYSFPSMEYPEGIQKKDSAGSHLTRSTRNLMQQAALTKLLWQHCLNGLDSQQKEEEQCENGCAKKARLEDAHHLDDVTFVEFGAGGGGWSHYLWTKIGMSSSTETSLTDNDSHNPSVSSNSGAVTDETQIAALKRAKFLLIDRETVRNKFDKRGICRSQPDGCQISRIRVDIEHLLLHQAPLITPSLPSTGEGSRNSQGVMVAISKHLCGDATDLTLRCLINYVKQRNSQECCSPVCEIPFVKGVVIALCCHHRCTLSQYCNWKWLKNAPCLDKPNDLSLAFKESEFPILARLTGWATCFGADIVKESLQSHGTEKWSESDPKLISITESKSATEILDELTAPYKASVGRMSKRLLDWGRVLFFYEKILLNELSLPNANPKLISYCDPSVTLENIAFVYAA